MSEPQAEVYDFRRPNQLADDVEQMLTSWHRGTVKLIDKKLFENFSINCEFEPGELRSLPVGDVESLHEAPTLVTEHRLGDETVGWLTIPRRFVLSLFELMFGQAPEADAEPPEDRELTDIEERLFSTVSLEFCAAMREAQPTENRLRCDFVGHPRLEDLTQTFPESEQVVVADIKLLEPFSGEAIRWVLSQSAILKFVTHVAESQSDQGAGRPELARLVHQVPVNVVIQLGNTQIRWDQLSKLAVGDIIMLDQRVSDPLQAKIANRPVFLGFPGKHGNRQAFRISEHVDPDES